MGITVREEKNNLSLLLSPVSLSRYVQRCLLLLDIAQLAALGSIAPTPPLATEHCSRISIAHHITDII